MVSTASCACHSFGLYLQSEPGSEFRPGVSVLTELYFISFSPCFFLVFSAQSIIYDDGSATRPPHNFI